MTTDTVRKECAYELQLSTGTVKIGAMAKGSGMIHPQYGDDARLCDDRCQG